jgi:peroxiredoxin
VKDDLLWIRFEERDRYSPAPDFCIPSRSGVDLCRDDFRGKCSLVLVFVQSSSSLEGRQLYESLWEKVNDYRDAGTKVLYIINEPADRIELPLETVDNYQLLVLSDEQGQVRRDYANLVDESLVRDRDVLVFILDMYGAPYYALSGQDLAHPEFHKEALKWLDFIGMQCPE